MSPDPVTTARIEAVGREVAAQGASTPRFARDPVNMAAIRNWTDAIGDTSPLYTDAVYANGTAHGELVAPPAMVQVWTMPGLPGPVGPGTDPLGQMMTVLDEAGYTSVVATNCEQTYHRYLRHGELLALRSELADVSGPKTTALGEGWFVTTRNTWYAGDEPVATMNWRVLKFKPPERGPAQPENPRLAADAGGTGGRPPGQAQPDQASRPAAGPDPGGTGGRPPGQAQPDQASRPAAGPDPGGTGGRPPGQAQPDQASRLAAEPSPMRPPYSPDTEFFWAGTRIGELRIQRCGACGALRHPPGPACLACGVTEKQEYQVAAGTGTVYSYVVHRHPPVPGKQLPIVIALVELTEGVRMLGELHGISPEQVSIGLPVRVAYARIDDELVLPGWRENTSARPGALPELVLRVTPTLVVSTAIATRDFYPVHHDHEFAVSSGSKDIFLNILTTTGLVQRFVTDWAGPEALVRSVSIRLGVPCYAGDTLTFSGQVSAADGGDQVVAVTGACSLGNHVTGTVRITPGRQA